ncbi:MAG TPA: endolytic transglycosylase MltG [Paenalcaligenes sp.]|nr:endolytic transglycosylase MltG [Paenalcaligenes sp.]
MKKTARLFLLFLLALLLISASVVGGGWWWVMKRPVAMDQPVVDYIVEHGKGPRSIANTMIEAGVNLHPDVFVALARLSKKDTSLQAGAYEATQGDTMWQLLERMVSGDMTQARLTFVEGWTFQRFREALEADSSVRQTLKDADEAEIRERLGITQPYIEGLFYPDTYVFVPGSSDFDILRRAYQAQEDLLMKLWEQRQPDLPLKTPYEALILASIVEKETGHAEDRARVAGVFINRLRVGMPLQTDPTVIYGMGERYQGRIRRSDLRRDTPWNTYTRNGLPPSPIANSGKAALQAALNPEKHEYYYFVSRGDGTSEFSRNLAAHNRAVAKYILGRN